MSDNPKIEKWLYPLSIEYNRRKVCECEDRHYILDAKNRLVYCSQCGAIIDPFDTLMDLTRNADRIQGCLHDYAEAAEKERRKYLRYKGVNGVTEHHRNGMIPRCPECGKPIDPADFSSYVNLKYVKGRGENES